MKVSRNIIIITNPFFLLLDKGCSVFICNFHRDQAWEHWFNKIVDGHSAGKSKIVPLLWRIACLETIEKSVEAIEVLKTSEYSSNRENLRDYLSKYWLKVKEVSKSITWLNASIHLWFLRQKNYKTRQNKILPTVIFLYLLINNLRMYLLV